MELAMAFGSSPPTLADQLQASQYESFASAQYWHCSDGQSGFYTSVGPFGGDENFVYGVDGTLIYASGPIPDVGVVPPLCGAVPALLATCPWCRIHTRYDACDRRIGGEAGAGGQAGAPGQGGTSGESGANGVGGADAECAEYCLIDASGALVMPPDSP